LQYYSNRHVGSVANRLIAISCVVVALAVCVMTADFGVSAKLNQTCSKRKSIVGSPYWMAPEVIVDSGGGYDLKADIWSLGITAIEMADGVPPHHQVHHARVIFVIPTSPPPTPKTPSKWSAEFNDFIACCVRKDPDERPRSSKLLEHPFIQRGWNNRAPLASLVAECAVQLSDLRYEQEIASEAWMQSSPLGSLEAGNIDEYKNVYIDSGIYARRESDSQDDEYYSSHNYHINNSNNSLNSYNDHHHYDEYDQEDDDQDGDIIE
jgi:serine/threonine protein kinase